MPRGARIISENACYHIITRGNQKQLVFHDPTDYERYLFTLAKYKRRFKFKLYSFCLMPNHVHLLLEVDASKKLQRIMRGLNLSYTLYFNSKHKKVGHLWQDRYKSRVIEKDSYLLECLNYIENNPVRAALTSSKENYQWSSSMLRQTNNKFVDSVFELV